MLTTTICSSLDLSHAGVGQECCKLLAEGILASTNLEKLSLEGNSIEQRYLFFKCSLPLPKIGFPPNTEQRCQGAEQGALGA